MALPAMELNTFLNAAKAALAEYVSNIAYIKNFHNSIAPKDRDFISRSCADIEASQQALLNYFNVLLQHEGNQFIQSLITQTHTIADLHVSFFAKTSFLTLLDGQKNVFIGQLNTLLITHQKNSALEMQAMMQQIHDEALKFIQVKPTLKLTDLFKRKKLSTIGIAIQKKGMILKHNAEISVSLTAVTPSQSQGINISQELLESHQQDREALLVDIKHLREVNIQLEKEKSAAEFRMMEENTRMQQEKLNSEQLINEKLVNEQREREKLEAERRALEVEKAQIEKMAIEQREREKLETERRLLEFEAERQALEQERQAQSEQLAFEQRERERLEAERLTLEAEKQNQIEKLANEYREREKSEREKLEAERRALEAEKQAQFEKLANEQREREKLEAERLALEAEKQIQIEKLANEFREREKSEREKLEAERRALEAEKQAQIEKLANEQREREKLEAERRALEEAAQLQRDKLIADQREKHKLEMERRAQEEAALRQREKLLAEQRALVNLATNQLQQEELKKMQLKEQAIQQKQHELRHIEESRHNKEREQKAIIKNIFNISREISDKERELQQILEKKELLMGEISELKQKQQINELQKQENVDMLLELERTRRQKAQDIASDEHARQRLAKNLPTEFSSSQQEDLPFIAPPHKRHSLMLEQASVRTREKLMVGAEERT